HRRRRLRWWWWTAVQVSFSGVPARRLPPRFGERPAGLCRRGNQKEVSGAAKPYGEASITTSIEPGVVFCRRDKGEPIWPTNRRHHLVEDSLRELLQLMFGKTKSALTK